MTPATSTTARFGDDEYTLFLSELSIMKIEIKFGGFRADGLRVHRSIVAIYDQLASSLVDRGDGTMKLVGAGDIFVHELHEILTLALADGNPALGEQGARALVSKFGVPNRPIEEVAGVVFMALHALLYGGAKIDDAKSRLTAEAA